jgi:hypothetical protein
VHWMAAGGRWGGEMGGEMGGEIGRMGRRMISDFILTVYGAPVVQVSEHDYI